MTPAYAGNRQVIAGEEWLGIDVGPGDHLRFRDDKRLDRESSLGDFDRTVFGDEAALAAAVDSDEGPARLLGGKAARVCSARRLACKAFEQCVGRGAEREILDLHLGQTIVVGRTLVKGQADESRLRFRQQEHIRATVAVDDAAHGSPSGAVVRKLDVVMRRKRPLLPVHDQTAEFTHAAEVDRKGLFLARRAIALPRCGEGPIDCERGFRTRQRR